jgi:hypothetical protein
MPTSGSAWQNEPKRVTAVGAIHCRGLRIGNIVIQLCNTEEPFSYFSGIIAQK